MRKGRLHKGVPLSATVRRAFKKTGGKMVLGWIGEQPPSPQPKKKQIKNKHNEQSSDNAKKRIIHDAE